MNGYIRHKFETIYQSERGKVIFFAQHYLGNRDEAEEVAQEVFMSVWNKIEELDLEKNMFPYLITLTRNRCLNILREKKNYSLNYSAGQIEKFAIHYSSLESADSSMIAAELNAILGHSLDKMPPKVRKAFLLSRNGIKYEEIAAMEGVSVKTIEYRMMSALRVFKQNCKDFLNYKV